MIRNITRTVNTILQCTYTYFLSFVLADKRKFRQFGGSLCAEVEHYPSVFMHSGLEDHEFFFFNSFEKVI